MQHMLKNLISNKKMNSDQAIYIYMKMSVEGTTFIKRWWTPACGKVLEDLETSVNAHFWKFGNSGRQARLHLESNIYTLLSEMRLYVVPNIVFVENKQFWLWMT